MRLSGEIFGNTESSGGRGTFIGKDGFNGGFKKPGEAEGQWEAGIVFPGFNGIDALPGDLKPLRKIGLTPVALGAQDTEPVLHWFLHS